MLCNISRCFMFKKYVHLCIEEKQNPIVGSVFRCINKGYPVATTIKGNFFYGAVFCTRNCSKHFASLTVNTISTSGKHLATLQLMPDVWSYKHPPLSIARYSFIQLSELEQCRVKKTCPTFLYSSTGFEPGFC